MAIFCLLGQDDRNKVQHDFIDHMMLVLASHDTDDILSSMNAFVNLILSKWDGFFSHLTLLASGIMMQMALSIAPLYLLGQENWNNVQHNTITATVTTWILIWPYTY